MEFKITFKPVLSEFKEAKLLTEEKLIAWKLPYMDLMDIMLAIDESITNIISHGYDSILPDDYIILEVSNQGGQIFIRIEDNGREFDFHATPAPDIRKNLSGIKKGGFGVHLIKSVMNTVEHSRNKNANILTLTKKINKDP